MTDEKIETRQEIVESHPGADHNKLLLEWKAPEFVRQAKSRNWYLIAGILTLCLVAYALYTGSATMAIVFIVLAGVYILTHNQEPKIISVKVTQMGIYVGSAYYPYSMIQTFWIVYHPPVIRTLNLKVSGMSASKVTIQLDEQSPVDVKALIVKEVPELKGQQETASEILIRLMRL